MAYLQQKMNAGTMHLNVYSVDTDDNVERSDIFKRLHEAVNAVRNSTTNSDAHYHSITIFNGREDDPDNLQDVTSVFWQASHMNDELNPQIEKFLLEVETALKDGHSRGAPRWDSEQTQFGEKEISILALGKLAFVPFYTKLLGQWDMYSEVGQSNVINNIVKKYGICPETEDLLFCRATDAAGQAGQDQIGEMFGYLDDQYRKRTDATFLRSLLTKCIRSFDNDFGGFTKSNLFIRIVAELHKKDLERREEKYQANLKRNSENPHHVSPWNPWQRSIFANDYFKDLNAATNHRLQELDRQASKSNEHFDQLFPN